MNEINDGFVTDYWREKAAKLKPRCSDCGGPGPFWVDDSGWPNVCVKCVSKKHKSIIKILTLINGGMCLLMSPFGVLAAFIVFLFFELIAIVGFWPYQRQSA